MKTNVFLVSFASTVQISFVSTIAVFAVMSADAAEEFSAVVLTEAKRAMSAAVFPDATKQDLQKYMPDGTAPASMSSLLVKINDDTILIDAGLGGESWVKELEKNIEKPETSVKLILMTHWHGDHIGGLLKDGKARFFSSLIRSSAKEKGYWMPKREPAKNKQVETLAKIYHIRLDDTFQFQERVYTNGNVSITAIDAAGHTPGHTAFLISSPKKKLLVIGDLLHGAALQFPKPEICATYDVNPDDAVKSRKKLLDYAADNNIPIMGMHLPAPCIGTVKKDGKGGYEYRPESEPHTK